MAPPPFAPPLPACVPPAGLAESAAGLGAALGAALGVLAAARRRHSSRSNLPTARDAGVLAAAPRSAEGGVPQLAAQCCRFSSVASPAPPPEHENLQQSAARRPGDRRPGD